MMNHAKNRKFNTAVYTVTATAIASTESGKGRVLVQTRDDKGALVDKAVQTISDVRESGIALPNPLDLTYLK